MAAPFFNPGTRDGFDGSGAGSYDGWLPVQYGDEALTRVIDASLIERLARSIPMAENTRTVPRFTNFQVATVAKGDQYAASTSYQDQIELVAKKVGGFTRLAEEDITGDLLTDPLQPIRNEAADALALTLDNSCLAVTAAPGAGVNFRSVYRAVRASQTDSDDFDAEFGYADDDNYEALTVAQFKAATTAATNGYDTLSDLLSRVEVGRFFEDANMVVMAHPSIKGYMRSVKDGNGQPVFTQNGVDLRGRPRYEYAGYPVEFSRGAKTSAVDSQDPTGNPLLIMGNRRMLIKGNRALAPQIPADTFGVALQRSAQGPGFLSDEAYFKAAYRRAFNVGTAAAFAVLEITP